MFKYCSVRIYRTGDGNDCSSFRAIVLNIFLARLMQLSVIFKVGSFVKPSINITESGNTVDKYIRFFIFKTRAFQLCGIYRTRLIRILKHKKLLSGLQGKNCVLYKTVFRLQEFNRKE